MTLQDFQNKLWRFSKEEREIAFIMKRFIESDTPYSDLFPLPNFLLEIEKEKVHQTFSDFINAITNYTDSLGIIDDNSPFELDNLLFRLSQITKNSDTCKNMVIRDFFDLNYFRFKKFIINNVWSDYPHIDENIEAETVGEIINHANRIWNKSIYDNEKAKEIITIVLFYPFYRAFVNTDPKCGIHDILKYFSK